MRSQRRRSNGGGDEEKEKEEEEVEEEEEVSHWIMQVVALFDYEPEEHDELAFQKGDIIRVERVQGDGWWRGYVIAAPRRLGVFPANYVQVQRRHPPEGDPNDAAPERQPISQQQIEPHVTFSLPQDTEEGEEEEENEEEYETQPTRLAPAVRTSSVLQLKQRLADAERDSRAAHQARRKAEQEQILRRQKRTIETRQQTVEEEDEIDAESGDGFVTQEQWKYQQRKTDFQDHGDDVGEDDEDERSEQRTRSDDEDEDDENDEEEERSHDDDDELLTVFTVQSGAMQNAIDEYDGDENSGVTPIPLGHRSHTIAHSLRRSVQRWRQEVEDARRQSEAVLVIQRWIVRIHSANNRKQEAATRIQHWVCRRLVYFRWLQRVEEKRAEMIERRKAKRRQEELQRQRKEEEAEAKQQRERERHRQQAEEREQQRMRQQERVKQEEEQARIEEENRKRAAATSEILQDAKKEKKRVMKREAVDLVTALVAQQLNEKLRGHDEQMMELQRMVARLHDVIRQQSDVIQQTTDEMLEQQQQQQQQQTTVHAGRRQIKPLGLSVSMEKAAPNLSVSLPLIQQSPLPAVTASSTGSRPSGIKPPRQLDRPTKLPLLTASNATTTLKRG